MKFSIYENKKCAPIIYDKCAFSGVKKIADRFAEDIKLTCGVKPVIYEYENSIFTNVSTGKSEVISEKNAIFICTSTNSEIVKAMLSKGKADIHEIIGKRECYKINIENGFDRKILGDSEIKNILVIIGSDKRGTIYGMFKVSEMIGVTSLVFFGDNKPIVKDKVLVDIKPQIVSKEPSIEYRGFFINDEWPAFGNWCNEQFGGFNAKCYEQVFIFLLRMKGNFLWPAMWSAVFSEDGPSIENARLADELGVVMGTSHHEPLYRAGEEWQHTYEKYGSSNKWSFLENREAITEFWRQGVKRNKNFESLVTIGMRGEADSKLLPENATMQDNIDVVMSAIRTQNEILKDEFSDISKVPRVLAIYKEVEDYYYGDEDTKGLKDYEELKDVIFLLSDDNWGNTRGLPTDEERKHPGGFGMYYHFDYHGGPISYEWQNTSRLSKINEQLMQAYEYGVKKLWIVNVGDIKGYEYPLNYFMDLAYDIERLGDINKIDDYMSDFLDSNFGIYFDKKQKKDFLEAIELYTRLNSSRKPESLNDRVYAPVNYNEAERVICLADKAISIVDKLKTEMIKSNRLSTCFDSVFYYQLVLTMNIHAMQAEASINRYLADNLSLMANVYADRIDARLDKIDALIEEYNTKAFPQWNHMLDSGFTGYRDWCDKDWGLPITRRVHPLHKGKIMVGFKNVEGFHLGEHWQDGEPICNEDFTRPDTKEVVIYLDSRGKVPFKFTTKSDKDWVKIKGGSGKQNPLVCPRNEIVLTIDREKITSNEKAYINVYVDFADGEKTVGKLSIMAAPMDIYMEDKIAVNGERVFNNVFAVNQGYVSINADSFAEVRDVLDNGYRVIKYAGREGNAVKCFPAVKDYSEQYDKPFLRYDFVASEEGTYIVEADVLQRNPVVKGEQMTFGLQMNDNGFICVNTVKDDYYTNTECPEWCMGVLDNVRRVNTEVSVKKGLNHMYIYAMSPDVMFDKFIIYNKEKGLKKSYFGPMESYRI